DDGPIPDFNLVHRWDKSHVIPIATSRGCPYACKFCSVIPMFGRKYRFKSINRVLQEVEASARKKSHVFFIDDNFAANKERTKELLREMIARKIKIEWSAQVRTEVANDTELIELMKKSGCFAVFIGFESINPMTLSLYNKSQNLGDIEKAIKTLKKYSINIHGMFVLGSDTDDIATIKNTAKFAKKLDIESVQFMVLTPLPGTPVFQEMKDSGRLIHTNWSAYDAHHAVFEPKLMTAFELHIETLKAMAKFYSWKTILKNLWRFDFFYAVVGIYGKRSVRKALSNAREYLEDLKNQLSTDFDKRTLKLRQKFLQQKGKTKEVILNTTSMQITEYQFFSTFLSKLDKKIIINKKDFDVTEGILAITPLVEHLKNRHEMGKQQLTDFYDKYRDRLESVEIVNMGSISLYKSCVNIGQLLGIKTKKIRKAYEQALKSIDGTPFECNNILILLSR
ncbi:B12-binding domain-containing radical SAM protein, partial [bacterium]|nr:B12-binding domain-containing radical SAM protein [bacterium]